jgi:succinate dehydrogenase / fumarate reductase membrane anchor subunit
MAASRMRSPLGRAIGLGAAKEGVEHWWLQRLTAVALVPLSLWFVASMVRQLGADFDQFQSWIARPLPGILMILTLIATFYHAALGLQVVIEDYVHGELARVAAVIAVRLACFALVVAGIYAVVSMALGGGS